MVFDPDWVISPRYTIEECAERQGITLDDLIIRLRLNQDSYWELFDPDYQVPSEIIERLEKELGGSSRYWENLFRFYQEGAKKGNHITK